MRNLKLTIAYDGTPYHGWQVQPGVPTVQGELEQVLERILNRGTVIHGSGRTDTGVHALAQVAHFMTDHTIELKTLESALNALLPPEIRIVAIEDMPPDFHARHSVRSKTYEYYLGSPSPSPFRCRYVYPVKYSLDTPSMERGASRLLGLHDFTSFCGAGSEKKSHVREVYEASWSERDGEWVFRIRANGFLRYMVRTIVGTLIEVGRHRIRWQEIDAILAAEDRQQAGPSAPPQGLFLVSVEY